MQENAQRMEGEGVWKRGFPPPPLHKKREIIMQRNKKGKKWKRNGNENGMEMESNKPSVHSISIPFSFQFHFAPFHSILLVIRMETQ